MELGSQIDGSDYCSTPTMDIKHWKLKIAIVACINSQPLACAIESSIHDILIIATKTEIIENSIH